MKRKIKIKNLVLLLVIVIFIGVCIYIFTNNEVKIQLTYKKGYLASVENNINLYEYFKEEDKESLEQVESLVRGTEISYHEDEKIIYEEIEYLKIYYNEKEYYVLSDNIVSKLEDVVLEDTLYVRTSYNLLKDLPSSLESSFRRIFWKRRESAS